MLEKIDKVLARSQGLSSEKERSFLESIRQQFIQRGILSPSQQSWFSSLDEKFSKENIKNFLEGLKYKIPNKIN